MKCVVTGGAGFINVMRCEGFVDRGEVASLDNYNSSYKSAEQVEKKEHFLQE